MTNKTESEQRSPDDLIATVAIAGLIAIILSVVVPIVIIAQGKWNSKSRDYTENEYHRLFVFACDLISNSSRKRKPLIPNITHCTFSG